MSSKLTASTVTRDAWTLTLKSFPYLVSIALVPFLINLGMHVGVTFYAMGHNPIPHSLVDGLGALIEALWGIRWFQFLLEKKPAKFAFGKQEFLYFFYSLLLITPFMLDDFLFVRGKTSFPIALGYAFSLLMVLILFLRFEFIYPALALKKKTGFKASWSLSGPYWNLLFKSYSQSFLVLLPVGCILLLGVGLLSISLWAAGFLSLEGWALDRHGWDILLQRNPAITCLYYFFKDGLWTLAQAFTMAIAAIYYKHSVK